MRHRDGDAGAHFAEVTRTITADRERATIVAERLHRDRRHARSKAGVQLVHTRPAPLAVR